MRDQVCVDDLVSVFTSMYGSNVVLDEDAIMELKKLGFKDPVSLANFCFRGGWNAAIKVVLQSLEKKRE